MRISAVQRVKCYLTPHMNPKKIIKHVKGENKKQTKKYLLPGSHNCRKHLVPNRMR